MTSPAPRRPLFCGNWKLHLDVAGSVSLATEVRNGVALVRHAEVAVAPGFVALAAVGKRLDGGPVALAAQDCHFEDQGAFTGAVSAPQLADVGCRFVIVGHSERRQVFGELDAAVNLKVKAALRAGLQPIVCVGETAAERDAGEATGRVGAQLDAALRDIDATGLGRLALAYEPVWAIGTGRNASPAQAQEVHAFLRTRLVAPFGAAAAGACRILYGGSVKPDNIRALMNQPDVDGALVGGAALVAATFVSIVKEGTV